VGDYLTLARGFSNESNAAVLALEFSELGTIGRYLVNGGDEVRYEAWVRALLAPTVKKVGWDPKPGESDEKKSLRANLLAVLGTTGKDAEAISQAARITEQALQNPDSVSSDLAGAAFAVTMRTGDSALYDRVMAAMRNAKTPGQYYLYFYTLSSFEDAQLMQRTLQFAITSEVRSQDTLGLIGAVMGNPAGEKLAWDFVRAHWPEIEKAGGPFASAQVIGSTGTFCDAGLKGEVNDFFSAHRVAAGERTFRQSMERISNCIDLKSQQTGQLATWLQSNGSGAADGSSLR